MGAGGSRGHHHGADPRGAEPPLDAEEERGAADRRGRTDRPLLHGHGHYSRTRAAFGRRQDQNAARCKLVHRPAPQHGFTGY